MLSIKTTLPWLLLNKVGELYVCDKIEEENNAFYQ
jgi:hypothetical protein